MADLKVICSRCNGEGHRAVACSKPFFKTCDHCQAVGHTSNKCPVLDQMLLKMSLTCAYCKEEGHTKFACEKKLKADKARAARMAKRNDDTKSETSEISTAVSSNSARRNTKPQRPQRGVLTESEEREARKIEKKLREIAALEDRLASGSPLDVLQEKKLDRKPPGCTICEPCFYVWFLCDAS